jgi:retron-type reverse transcriptase
MRNIISLHTDLKNKKYIHGGYYAFNISDPKPRNIHKASVRDRLLHHALYRILYPFFDKKFITDSYSCRLDKGTHKALGTFQKFLYKVSKNRTKIVWILKCDVRKFFASIDQKILIEILAEYISDKDVIWLLSQIIGSFHSTKKDVGLPLGNLTSQLLVNIYMNEFDQFVKHRIKAKYYIRYADDFVIFSTNKNELKNILFRINNFLLNRLRLILHPDKVFIKTIGSGMDFLGWINFSDHRVLRTVTKKRMLRNIKLKDGKKETMQSYIGLLAHGNGKKLAEKIKIIQRY